MAITPKWRSQMFITPVTSFKSYVRGNIIIQHLRVPSSHVRNETENVGRTLWECPKVTVPSNPVEFSLSWRGRNSFDECSSAFEVPPATFNNLQGPGLTDRVGTQDTHKRTHTRAHKLQNAAKNPKVVFATQTSRWYNV